MAEIQLTEQMQKTIEDLCAAGVKNGGKLPMITSCSPG